MDQKFYQGNWAEKFLSLIDEVWCVVKPKGFPGKFNQK